MKTTDFCPLGASWESSRGPLGPSWEPVGPFTGHLGPILGHLGAISCHPEEPKIVKKQWFFLGFCTLSLLKPHPASSSFSHTHLRHLGAILGPSWAHLGPSRGHPGPSWGHLGPSRGYLGPSWGILGLSWGNLGPPWAILRLSWTILGAILGHLAAMHRAVFGTS